MYLFTYTGVQDDFYEGSQYLVEVEVEEVEGCVIPVPLATPVVLLLNHTNII
jgi:hypothetical protein